MEEEAPRRIQADESGKEESGGQEGIDGGGKGQERSASLKRSWRRSRRELDVSNAALDVMLKKFEGADKILSKTKSALERMGWRLCWS